MKLIEMGEKWNLFVPWSFFQSARGRKYRKGHPGYRNKKAFQEM